MPAPVDPWTPPPELLAEIDQELEQAKAFGAYSPVVTDECRRLAEQVAAQIESDQASVPTGLSRRGILIEANAHWLIRSFNSWKSERDPVVAGRRMVVLSLTVDGLAAALDLEDEL